MWRPGAKPQEYRELEARTSSPTIEAHTARRFRRLEVAPWSDIAGNYAATTRELLAPVMDPGYSGAMTGPVSTRRLETFSYLPPLSDDELALQVGSILERRLIPAIEYATDPGPRTVCWSMWTLPVFDAATSGQVLAEVDACARAHPEAFVKLTGYDAKRQGQVASFVVRRPA